MISLIPVALASSYSTYAESFTCWHCVALSLPAWKLQTLIVTESYIVEVHHHTFEIFGDRHFGNMKIFGFCSCGGASGVWGSILKIKYFCSKAHEYLHIWRQYTASSKCESVFAPKLVIKNILEKERLLDPYFLYMQKLPQKWTKDLNIRANTIKHL